LIYAPAMSPPHPTKLAAFDHL